MKLFTQLICSLAVAACAGIVQAQEPFPSKPVTLIVPYPPGGAVDTFARALADGLKQEWKAGVVIDNRPGGSEVIGAAALAKAHPDGYTIMASTEAASILNPLLFKKLPYDAAKDIAPVSILVRAPLVLAVPSSSPANTLREFIDMARARASNPVRYGSAGAGGTGHLPFIQLASDHQLQLIHAPYRGAGPMLQDLLGGHIEAGLLGTAVAEPHIRSGKIKGLAVTADKRLASLPMVPTYQELGIPDINATFIVALSAPAGTPSPIVDAIAQAARKVLQNPEFQSKTLNPFGFVPVGSDPASFGDYIRREIPVQKKRIQIGNISLEM
ncbi:MAG: tripartite tricarboxylate transporter substrate binding protein [Polaromonas sp.]|uniref:Bug family tripartite tricarboxylate transporter substrate binding protein n=1 Tax=Polaromonas sp. TaxID=1869339 RepID=UPI002736071F|nr:tripartite tricarboxylate transporter substrate binding protein [Polaromonas sp.]MDP3799218.1 tripartite tricarboxylate transporter substrate binding protein [Polaromonas sp.]